MILATRANFSGASSLRPFRRRSCKILGWMVTYSCPLALGTSRLHLFEGDFAMPRQLSGHLGRLACLLCLVTGASWTLGDEPKQGEDTQATPKTEAKGTEAKEKPAAAPTDLQIAQWIKDLDSD